VIARVQSNEDRHLNRYSPAQLEGLVAKITEKVGVPAEEAAILAESLVYADLHGTSTHGVSRLDIYLRRIEKGLIKRDARLIIRHGAGGALSLDADNGLGQVQARKALDLLCPLAKKNGVASATLRNSEHFCALC